MLMEYPGSIIQRMDIGEFYYGVEKEYSNVPYAFVTSVKKSVKSGISSE